MAERCFLYNSRLRLQLGATVRMPSGVPPRVSGRPCTDYQLMQSWILSAGDPDCGPLGRLLDPADRPKGGR